MKEYNIKELVNYLLIGDESGSWNLISNWIMGKESVTLYENILAEAMRLVGDLWEMNEITVADEHVASNICNLLISRYTQELDIINQQQPLTITEPERKAMLFCIEGEEHSIGMKMVSSLFKEYGWETRYLGANLPVHDAIIYANKWRPNVIGISLSIVYNLPKLIEFFNEINKLEYSPQIIVGGRITSLYRLENYCPSDVVIIKELHSLNTMFLENKLCTHTYAII